MPWNGPHNALVSLGNRLYLELVALQTGAAPLPYFSERAALDHLTPIGWAASTPSSQDARVTPGGTTLQRETFELEQEPPGAPFFIAWAAGSAHPSATSPTACKLKSFTIATPQREILDRLLSLLEISTRVVEAQAGRFTVALDCPEGGVVFDSGTL
jgi:hypothetical protein